MKFSIIIPVYKVEKYIEQCIESVLNQDYTDFEVICVDDGTPDQSAELCEKYLCDYRVRIIHKKNGGLSSARNEGIRFAEGQYLIFLDSDDYWVGTNSLTRLSIVLEKENPDVLIFGNTDFNCITGEEIQHIYPEKKFCSEIEKAELIEEGYFKACAWNKVVASKLFKQENLYFREGIVGEDNDWCARLLLYADSIMTSDVCMYTYRKNRNGSITSATNRKYVNDQLNSLTQCFVYTREQPRKSAYWGYVAFFYVLILGEAAQLPKPDREDYIGQLKRYRWLLKYRLNPKTKVCYYVKLIFGYRVLVSLLGYYYKIHGRIN